MIVSRVTDPYEIRMLVVGYLQGLAERYRQEESRCPTMYDVAADALYTKDSEGVPIALSLLEQELRQVEQVPDEVVLRGGERNSAQNKREQLKRWLSALENWWKQERRHTVRRWLVLLPDASIRHQTAAQHLLRGDTARARAILELYQRDPHVAPYYQAWMEALSD